MAGSFWSGAGSGIISGALGLLGAGLNQGFSAVNSSRQARNTKKVLKYQDELNRAYTRDSYGIMREGLQKAGYNPLLALGSSANSVSYGGSAGLSDSDQGSEAISSAIDAMRLKNENKLNNATVEKLEEEKKGVKLDNSLKEANLNLSPKKIISDIVTDKKNKIVDFVKDKLGIGGNSAVSVPNRKSYHVDLSDGKPYVQKGVPASVVKKLRSSGSNSAVSSQKLNSRIGVWNSKLSFPGRFLSDKEVNQLSKRRINNYKYSRPPKGFPAGM